MDAKAKYICVSKKPEYNVKNKTHPIFALYAFRNSSCKCPWDLEEAIKCVVDDINRDDADEFTAQEEWNAIKKETPSLTIRALYKWWWPRLIRDGYLLPAKHDQCEECRGLTDSEDEKSEPEPEPEPKPEPKPAPAVEEAGPPQEAPKPEEAPKPARRVLKLKKSAPASSGEGQDDHP